jgi:hypothetical protein
MDDRIDPADPVDQLVGLRAIYLLLWTVLTRGNRLT